MKLRTAVVSLVLVVLLLAGCGNSGDGTVASSTTTQVLQAPVFPEGSTMAKIQKSGKIRVGVQFNQPGFGMKTGDAAPVGFDVEISRMLAQGIFGGTLDNIDQHITWVEAVSTNREAFLKDGKVDMVLASYPVTEARRAQVDFAGPYYMAHGDVMVSTDDRSIQQITDLNGRKVCAKSGSLLTASLKVKAPQVNVVTADTYAQCTQKLKDHAVDGVFSDEVLLAGLVQTSNGTARVLNSNFSDDPYGIGVVKGDDVFRAFLNERLQNVETSGGWKQAYRQTIGQLGLPVPDPPQIDRYLGTIG